ncbi:MAG: hypothetical protein M3Q58_07245 [Bacteroidota bacterium]|nr:hypothetical protein [Bacteroidota bacterium]
MQTKTFVFLFVFLIFPMVFKAQESFIKKFRQLSVAEKIWVIKHPFIAKKASRITQNALSVSKNLKSEYEQIDTDFIGGQADAFKHCFWMATLVQEIAPKKALKLGKAHEKGNFRQYKNWKNKPEAMPDKPLSEMDFFNNNWGVCFGMNNKKLNQEEFKIHIIESLLNGEMKIIKKDNQGNCLDSFGNIIDPELLKKWDNPKCLVPSNYQNN